MVPPCCPARPARGGQSRGRCRGRALLVVKKRLEGAARESRRPCRSRYRRTVEFHAGQRARCSRFRGAEEGLSALSRVVSVIRPPPGMASRAFSTRFSRICCTRAGSIRTAPRFAGEGRCGRTTFSPIRRAQQTLHAPVTTPFSANPSASVRSEGRVEREQLPLRWLAPCSPAARISRAWRQRPAAGLPVRQSGGRSTA